MVGTVTIGGDAEDADFTAAVIQSIVDAANLAGIAPSDQTAASVTLTWGTGDTAFLDVVLTVSDDGLTDSPEDLTLSLSGATVDSGSASIVSGKELATVTIEDQDLGPPPVSCLDKPQADLDLIDPVKALLEEGVITSSCQDIGLERKGIMTGISADGAAQLVVRFNAPSRGNVRFTLFDEDDTQISSLDEGGSFEGIPTCGLPVGSGATIGVETFDARLLRAPKAVVLYSAPEFFVRNESSDADRAEREVFVQTEFSPVEGGPSEIFCNPIRVVRPPVTLVHGIWSNPDTWESLPPPTEGHPSLKDENGRFECAPPQCPFFAKPISYEREHASNFSRAAELVGLEIRNVLSAFKKKVDVAGVRTDVVAHSMGGNPTLPLDFRAS